MTLMMNAAASFSLICGLKRPLTKNKRKKTINVNTFWVEITVSQSSGTGSVPYMLHSLFVFFNSRWLRFVCLPFLTPTE